jgi:acetyl esterase/lipase
MQDSLTAYRWLLAQGVKPANILVVGESAGGGLGLALLLALRDEGLPLPSAAVALSPWTDLELMGKSRAVKKGMAPVGMDVVCCKYYVGDNDPSLPWISPVYGDLRGLPPLLIFVGDAEGMLVDSTRFTEKARAAGVEVTLRVGEGMDHCYPLFDPLFPEATQAMAEIYDFIKRRLC